MLRMRIEARHGLRWGLLSLATAIALTAVSSDPADAAQPPQQANGHGRTSSYSPGYAAIVVDANTGSILHSANADAIRHPASLTKIMTLYMLFERLESGKLSLDSPLRVSEHAADQSPTKLGLREGSTITVEDAIKGMVTRSANDAAVVVAENLAGSEEEFARQMTRKARALGMSHTVYRNASGLPDSAQVTTARDQAMLGRAIQERFPRYYRYFSTRIVHLPRPAHRQSQPPARQGRRRRRHQDRLHPRLRIQSGHLGAARRPPCRRGRARRHQRRRPRRAHAPAAGAARRQRLDPPHRADDRRSAGRATRRRRARPTQAAGRATRVAQPRSPIALRWRAPANIRAVAAPTRRSRRRPPARPSRSARSRSAPFR